MIRIEGATSITTDIEFRNHNGEVIFSGLLERGQDQWTLSDTASYGGGTFVAKFAGRRTYLGALRGALEWIEAHSPGAKS